MEEQKDSDATSNCNPFDNDPLLKREKFAVSLRKKKTAELVREKRRKIMSSLSKRGEITEEERNVQSLLNKHEHVWRDREF